MVGLCLAADNNIQPWQRPHDLHGFKAHSDNPLKEFERVGRIPDRTVSVAVSSSLLFDALY